jgi:hypothetical protein
MEQSQPSEISSVLRPLSVVELLDRALSLYRNHFLLFFGIGLVPRGAALAIALWADATLHFGMPHRSVPVFFMLLGQWIITLPIYMITLAISHAMTMLAVSNAYLQRPLRLHEAYMKARPYLGTLFWLALQTTIRILLGFLLFVIPGVYLALSYSVSVPAAVFENLKAGKALERSTELTEGYRGRIFGLYFFYWLMSYIVTFSARYLVRLHDPAFLGTVLIECVRFFSGALTTPVLLIAFALLYYDLRVRKEAFDLQYMMASLDATDSAAAPAKA